MPIATAHLDESNITAKADIGTKGAEFERIPVAPLH